jgi:hypothetical protein
MSSEYYKSGKNLVKMKILYLETDCNKVISMNQTGPASGKEQKKSKNASGNLLTRGVLCHNNKMLC